MRLYYQINYTLTEVPEDEAYFHAQFRRSNPTQGSLHTLIDGVKGKGQYVGTYLAWRVNDNCWWGEGEIKFYMDGDREYPTICGTGVEDYICVRTISRTRRRASTRSSPPLMPACTR